jgi:hypothetical protein
MVGLSLASSYWRVHYLTNRSRARFLKLSRKQLPISYRSAVVQGVAERVDSDRPFKNTIRSPGGLKSGAKPGIEVSVPLGILAIIGRLFFILREKKAQIGPSKLQKSFSNEMGDETERHEIDSKPYHPELQGSKTRHELNGEGATPAIERGFEEMHPE